METQDTQIGGALAGGLIATAQGILTATDARNVLLNARRTIGAGTLNAEQRGAASVFDFFLNRYPELG
jgi:hypothetical protein